MQINKSMTNGEKRLTNVENAHNLGGKNIFRYTMGKKHVQNA